MQVGLVSSVRVAADNTYFGFLITQEGSIYFSSHDYEPFCVDIDKDIVTLWGEGKRPEPPNIDDRLYFMLGTDNQGRLKAEAWCTEAEGKRIEELLANGEKFSVVETVKNRPVTIWTGYDPVLFQYETRLKYPVEQNSKYINGIYHSYNELQQVST